MRIVIVIVAAVGSIVAAVLAVALHSEVDSIEEPNWGRAGAYALAFGRAVADRDERKARRDDAKVPSARALRHAAAYARRRDGLVSFAVVNTEGRLRGRTAGRLYPAASTVKAMLLAAEVRRLEREHEPLDEYAESLLRAMITYSDNDAADAVYARVGDEGMFTIARKAGMDRFTEAGHWGNAQIDAADLARLYWRMPQLVDGHHRAFALGLLGSVIAEQSWGIPAAARPDWSVRFKGGWLPDRGLVHQGAELRDDGRRLTIAVLTNFEPTFGYGTETIEGIAARLLSGSGGGASSARSGSRPRP